MTVGNHGQNLIYIISQPRSGSTLLQRILAAHPQIDTKAETWLMLHPLYAVRSDGIKTEYDHYLAKSALISYLSNMPDGQRVYQDAIRDFAVSLYNSSLTKSLADRFVDKTPRYYFIVDELHHLFPEAKFILLFRNPVAVLSSILTTHVQGYWPMLSKYKDDLILAPRNITQLKKQGYDNVLSLRYEQLVTRPQETLAHLCAFLEIPFIESMIEYGEYQPPSGSFGDNTHIRRVNRPTPERIDIWKELNRDQQTSQLAIGYLDELGSEIISLMGYDRQAIDKEFEGKKQRKNNRIATWNDLIHPDPEQVTRHKYTELAILEHRRLVFRIKSILNRKSNP